MALKNSGTGGPFPSRIVCLSYDIFEILCAIGCGERIVGKPSGADKPGIERAVDIGGFAKPDINAIVAVKPDIVIGYSEICAGAMAKLINQNINTLVLHHTSLEEIYESAALLGRVAGNTREADTLINNMRREFRKIAVAASKRPHRPAIYFEEWNNPYVCGIQWVSEIIDIAGGRDVFRHKSQPRKFLERRVTAEEIAAAAPEIILASWCGNPVETGSFQRRPGWEAVPAIKTNSIYEVPGEIILQPGPGLVKGAKFMSDIIDKYIIQQKKHDIKNYGSIQTMFLLWQVFFVS